MSPPSPPLASDSTSPPLGDPHPSPVSPTLLSTLSWDNISRLIHREGSSFPPIRPCDRASGSDTKTHWTSKDLHRAMGCCRFQNYKHILQTSLDGQWIDGGKFTMALESYATIPKATRCGNIDRTKSLFLDIVYVYIAFGDCILVGGFCYALILVNRQPVTTGYTALRTFPVTLFSPPCITSRLTRGLMLAVSAQTVMQNCLAHSFANTSSTMIQIS